MRPVILCLLCLGLAACAKFPQLDAAVTDRAKESGYPTLIPEAEINANPSPNRLVDGEGEALLERAGLLRGRATTLRANTPDAAVRRAALLRERAKILRNITQVDDAARRRYAKRLKELGG